MLTRRYWALQSMVTAVVGPVGDLVATEIDEREAAFREACEALERLIQRWSRPGVLVVPDTSFYIEHQQKLEDADFAAALGAQGDGTYLFVPIVIVDELDGLKKHNDKHTRWRAGYTLAVLDRVLTNGTGPAQLHEEDSSEPDTDGSRRRITVEVVLDPPGHVRLPINDDEIIDRILAIQPLTGHQVTLLTYDTNQSARARAAGVSVIKLNQPLDPEPPGRNTGPGNAAVTPAGPE